jgi:hypothetical protein
MMTLRLAIGVALAVVVTGGAPAADDPGAAYPAATAAVLANHEAVAQQWYQALAASQPAPPPLILRLSIPRCFGNASLMLEDIHGTGMPREARVWETSRRMALTTTDCSKLTIAGTPESGSFASCPCDLVDCLRWHDSSRRHGRS